MSKSDRSPSKRAVALQYGADDAAPVVVASGMGYLAEKIVDVAVDHGVPVYEDDSLATVLSSHCRDLYLLFKIRSIQTRRRPPGHVRQRIVIF